MDFLMCYMYMQKYIGVSHHKRCYVVEGISRNAMCAS